MNSAWVEEMFSDPQSWPIKQVSMSRDFFDRHKADVNRSARKYGFSVLGATENKDPEALWFQRGTVTFTILDNKGVL